MIRVMTMMASIRACPSAGPPVAEIAVPECPRDLPKGTRSSSQHCMLEFNLIVTFVIFYGFGSDIEAQQMNKLPSTPRLVDGMPFFVQKWYECD